MLQKLDDRVLDCLLHAEHCRRRAEQIADLIAKDDFLALEQRWLDLARSYEFSERLSAFTASRGRPA